MTLEKWLTRAGLTGKKLEVTLRLCADNLVETVDDLKKLALDKSRFHATFPQSMLQSVLLGALQVQDAAPLERGRKVQAGQVSNTTENAPAKPMKQTVDSRLPPSKSFHYFASHKKLHSRFGRDSETLALKFKDLLNLKYNLKGWFDADNLQRITLEKLSEGIAHSCCVLLFLNDETLSSSWCVHEVKTARKLGIPIISLVDADLQPVRQVVDGYLAQGYDWLFDEQCVQYSTQGREKSYELVAQAIHRAVESGGSRPRKEAAPKKHKAKKHPADSTVHGTATSVDLLKGALIKQFGSAKAAFEQVSNADGIVGKKEWKRVVSRLLPLLTAQEKKSLRVVLPKKANADAFVRFCGGDDAAEVGEVTVSRKHNARLAKLPDEVPNLPPSFLSRGYSTTRLQQALLISTGGEAAAVTTPTSRISCQGMGGVGKSLLASSIVRSEPTRKFFDCICWLSLSQSCDIMRLQQRLHEQLMDTQGIPVESRETFDQQKGTLIKAAGQQTVLIVLDDCWSDCWSHFDCINATNASKLLLTTRVRKILSSRGVEIVLDLMGLQESVELLAAVSELDVDQVPHICVQIAQLCGRLPLCLNIIGMLIQSYGSDSSWIEEVPSLIRRDMKSLTDCGTSNMNLQQRVIQSGLDSITGDHAENIIILFKSMAVFAEDQIFPVAILSVLWTSLVIAKGTISAITLRQWCSELLSRSILIGSVGEGLAMHDLVRDFTLSSHTAEALTQLQRCFVNTMLASYDNIGGQTSKASLILKTYIVSELTHHFKSALTTPLSEDEIARKALLHPDDNIVDQVLQSVTREAVVELAESLVAGGDHWSSARLHFNLAFKCRGIELQQSLIFMRLCLSALERHVPSSQHGATELKAYTMSRLRSRTTDKAESQSLFERMLRWTRDLNDPPPPRVLVTTGVTLLSAYPSQYAINRSIGSVSQGGDMLLAAATASVQSIEKLQPGFSKLAKIFTSLFNAHLINTPSCASSKWGKACTLLLGTEGGRILIAADMYTETLHARFIAQNRMDYYLQCGGGAPALFNIFADVYGAGTLTERWEASDQAAKLYNLEQFSCICLLHPTLAAFAPRVLVNVMGRWLVSFHNAHGWTEDFPVPLSTGLRWTIQDDDDDGARAWAFQPESCAEFVKALFAAQITNSVSIAEIKEWLPAVDCRAVHDRIVPEWGLDATLSTFLAMAAMNVGGLETGLQYTRHWLEISLNPLKDCHAHTHLGSILRMNHKQDSDAE